MSYIGSVPALENVNPVGTNSVETQDLQNAAVTTDKIANATITTDKIANAAVTADKLAAGAAVPTQTGQTGKFLTTDGTSASWATVVSGPTISSLVYSGNDLATDTTTPLPVTIIGTGFVANTKVYIDTVTNANSATALQFSGTTQITFTPPAKSAASYNVWVVTPNGQMAVLANGILYSGTPSWTGVATSYTSQTAVSIQLSATSTDTPLTYSLVSGTLPTGVTLSSSGLLSGTVTGLVSDTTFSNIVISASDQQNQDASITIQLSISVITQISRSLRFNSADSAYLTKTFASAGNQKTWTWSGWVKLTNLGANRTLFERRAGASDSTIMALSIGDGNYGTTKDALIIARYSFYNLITTQVFRDPSAWYHIVLSADTTQATASNRLKLYINGEQITAFSSATYPSLNEDLPINAAATHDIGRATYFDGYMAEVNFIGGQALTPASFGAISGNTGVWSPVRYIGAYGTNGFYLNFANNSTANSFGLGSDSSSTAGINRIELGNTSTGYTVLGTMTFGSAGANINNLRDGLATTSAADPNGLTSTTNLGYDFGQAIKVRRIVTVTDNTGSGNQNQAVLNIQYSDNNSTWTTVTGSATQHTVSTGQGVTNTTNIDDNGAHRYWRLYYASGSLGGNFWIATLDMYASDIGANSWYPVNFSVTAGVGNDSLVDSPTSYGTDTGAGGEVRGNYCILNTLSAQGGTLSQGGLRYTGPGDWRRINGTIAVSTGKWYWEVTMAANPYSSRYAGADYHSFGIGSPSGTAGNPANISDAVLLSDVGFYQNFSGTKTDTGSAFVAGDVLSIAVDLDANTFVFRKNNVQLVSGTIGGTPGRELTPTLTSYSTDYGVMDFNFGQRPFAYTAPSGFKALCTQNLPTPAVGATTATQTSKYFNTVLWTGTGTSSARSITGVGFQPDFVWSKPRSVAYQHNLYDVLRGSGKRLISNSTDAEVTNAAYGYLSSFDSDGFSTTAGATNNENWNQTNATYVAWNWKAGGAGVTNTQGTITSTVSANQTSGFSIVTWTGNTSANPATLGHGLGAAPKFVIVKPVGEAQGFVCYHEALGINQYIMLNSTTASGSYTSYWGSTAFTSTVFGVFPGGQGNNNRSGNMIAYCFAEVPGFSRFGSYAGNGSTDGPFVYCGFRPKYVMWKSTAADRMWIIQDTARQTYNAAPNNAYNLGANSTAAENDGTVLGGPANANNIDWLSNGFKIKYNNPNCNNSGETYIFMAFAETPFKYALAR